ncbi:hypothetical protein N0V95_007096 [Ascochyta clinopodiicola]|nr:hypothetical protein N0V95_007096 [Ascochyta clinopodiicola]
MSQKIAEVVVDFNSESSLVSALTGHDAVVSTVGTTGLTTQVAIIKAAIAAGVKRFIPSEFGSDLKNPLVRQLPVYAEKVKVEDLLEQEAAKGTLTYTIIYNNLYLDWGLQYAYIADVLNRSATLYDGGSLPLSMTRLSTVAKAVVGVLRNPKDTENRCLRIHDGRLSKRELVSALQETTGKEGWTVQESDSVAVQAKSDKALSEGVFDEWVWLGYITRASQAKECGPSFNEAQNALLGLKEHSADEMKGLVQTIAKEIIQSGKTQ